MSYTAEEFKAALEAAVIEDNKTTRYFDLYDFWSWENIGGYLSQPLEIEPYVVVTLIDQNEELSEIEDFTRAEKVWNVFMVSFNDGSVQYFRRDGQVQSWDSDEMGEIYEVRPKEKTIIVFEKE